MAKIIKGDWMKLGASVKSKKKKVKELGASGPGQVYQLKISLKGSKPLIWRRILVKGETTLARLHLVIQYAMGWGNDHLHLFEIDGVTYSEVEGDMALDDAEDENAVQLSAAVPNAKSKFYYEYDMGDSWLHTIVVEKILPPEADQQLPSCVAGECACPPEDCGGLWGYYGMLDILADPKHEEHEDMKEWVDDDFDPNMFDMAAANKSLKSLRK